MRGDIIPPGLQNTGLKSAGAGGENDVEGIVSRQRRQDGAARINAKGGQTGGQRRVAVVCLFPRGQGAGKPDIHLPGQRLVMHGLTHKRENVRHVRRAGGDGPVGLFHDFRVKDLAGGHGQEGARGHAVSGDQGGSRVGLELLTARKGRAHLRQPWRIPLVEPGDDAGHPAISGGGIHGLAVGHGPPDVDGGARVIARDMAHFMSQNGAQLIGVQSQHERQADGDARVAALYKAVLQQGRGIVFGGDAQRGDVRGVQASGRVIHHLPQPGRVPPGKFDMRLFFGTALEHAPQQGQTDDDHRQADLEADCHALMRGQRMPKQPAAAAQQQSHEAIQKNGPQKGEGQQLPFRRSAGARGWLPIA